MRKFMLVSAAVAAAVLFGGCASMEYVDTNRAVDANILCTGQSDNPAQPVSRDCERRSEVNWNTGNKGDDKPLDFSGKSKDD